MLQGLSQILLFFASLALLQKGVVFALFTTGVVQGSEFSMLISICNQLAYVMIWLAAAGVYAILNK
jgi:hypothetical protein